jgi:hypothetical protein
LKLHVFDNAVPEHRAILVAKDARFSVQGFCVDTNRRCRLAWAVPARMVVIALNPRLAFAVPTAHP